MEKVKVGGDEITIGHMIRVKCVKNKVAPPFRKAEFMIYYDGRKVDKIDELASVALQKGLIPRYSSDGKLSETGRTFKLSIEDEELIAKKRDEVSVELKKYPKIQEHLLNEIKNGIEPINYEKPDETDNMTEAEFEKSLNDDDSNGAEETESWNDI